MALRNHFKDLIELQSFVSPLLILSYMNKRVFYRLGQKTEMIKFPLIGTKRQRTHCIPNPWKWYHYKQGLTRPDQRAFLLIAKFPCSLGFVLDTSAYWLHLPDVGIRYSGTRYFSPHAVEMSVQKEKLSWNIWSYQTSDWLVLCGEIYCVKWH